MAIIILGFIASATSEISIGFSTYRISCCSEPVAGSHLGAYTGTRFS